MLFLYSLLVKGTNNWILMIVFFKIILLKICIKINGKILNAVKKAYLLKFWLAEFINKIMMQSTGLMISFHSSDSYKAISSTSYLPVDLLTQYKSFSLFFPFMINYWQEFNPIISTKYSCILFQPIANLILSLDYSHHQKSLHQLVQVWCQHV